MFGGRVVSVRRGRVVKVFGGDFIGLASLALSRSRFPIIVAPSALSLDALSLRFSSSTSVITSVA